MYITDTHNELKHMTKAMINSTFYQKICAWSKLSLCTQNYSEDDSVNQGFINPTCCQYVGKITLSLQPYCL